MSDEDVEPYNPDIPLHPPQPMADALEVDFLNYDGDFEWGNGMYPVYAPTVDVGYLPGAAITHDQISHKENSPAWMQRPCINGCPLGLEFLTQLDQLLVQHHPTDAQTRSTVETQVQYAVMNSLGQRVYMCKEESDVCKRIWLGSHRSFIMHVLDSTGIEVITILRPCKCPCWYECLSCMECCQDEVEIRTSHGETMGFVKQIWKGCSAHYLIKDSNSETVLRIQGPSYCFCKCISEDVTFKIMSADGTTEVGMISKQWSGLVREYFSYTDNFGVQFPINLDVKIKAVMLGAVFLIDFVYFETRY